jgi:hypothetical protein
VTERSKSFALECAFAVTDLSPREKYLQPVIGGARQQHAAKDLAPLGSGQ